MRIKDLTIKITFSLNLQYYYKVYRWRSMSINNLFDSCLKETTLSLAAAFSNFYNIFSFSFPSLACRNIYISSKSYPCLTTTFNTVITTTLPPLPNSDLHHPSPLTSRPRTKGERNKRAKSGQKKIINHNTNIISYIRAETEE